MNRWQRTAAASIAVGALCVVVPATVATQIAPPPAVPRGEAVKGGERFFFQRCSLCHMGRIVKDDTYKPMGPGLEGVLKNVDAERERMIRDRIQRGSQRMPAFKYEFTPTEFEELVTYLKTL